jgi:hypothetical protein
MKRDKEMSSREFGSILGFPNGSFQKSTGIKVVPILGQGLGNQRR